MWASTASPGSCRFLAPTLRGLTGLHKASKPQSYVVSCGFPLGETARNALGGGGSSLHQQQHPTPTRTCPQILQPPQKLGSSHRVTKCHGAESRAPRLVGRCCHRDHGRVRHRQPCGHRPPQPEGDAGAVSHLSVLAKSPPAFAKAKAGQGLRAERWLPPGLQLPRVMPCLRVDPGPGEVRGADGGRVPARSWDLL